MSFAVAFLAMLLDRFMPFPDWIGRGFAHPVVWQGKVIEVIEQRFNSENSSDKSRKISGTIMLAILCILSLAGTLIALWFVRLFPFSWVLEALLASVFLAHRSLHQAVLSVASALDISLDAARVQVSHIVGRDTEELDKSEICRAAIESLAENSSDGIIAPLFWLVLFGLPGIVIYKAINTADSMVGHKNQKYRDFGWASARLDDVVNWLPARICALLYALAAGFDGQKAIRQSWQTARRDAPTHISPNAGWPEAALAGALGFSLGGPRRYNGQDIKLASMGNGRRELGVADIHQALKLSRHMSNIAMAAIGILVLMQLVF